MKSDLSKVNVGDCIWTVQLGWAEVIEFDMYGEYPIYVKNKYGRFMRFTVDGKLHKHDLYPSAFIEPLKGFNAPPKPYIPKKGDKVLVATSKRHPWLRRYFSHIDKITGKYCCFVGGKDEWSSNGEIGSWDYCKKWEENIERNCA